MPQTGQFQSGAALTDARAARKRAAKFMIDGFVDAVLLGLCCWGCAAGAVLLCAAPERPTLEERGCPDDDVGAAKRQGR
jgi:hypothetical protein